MKLSNSAFTSFWTCPVKFSFEFIEGLRKQTPWFAFGARWHSYLESYYCNRTLPEPVYNLQFTEADELTIASMFEAYRAHYPEETFEIVDCEKKFELLIPGSEHFYLGKIDMLVQDKSSGMLSVFETKTESRGSKRNLPDAWAVRSQASLYTWAATQIYGEPIDHILLNVCTKPSPKGQQGPTFRRDILERTTQQVQSALQSLLYVAEQTEHMRDIRYFPSNTNSCVSESGWKCDFYSLCHLGETPELLAQFEKSEPFSYLEL